MKREIEEINRLRIEHAKLIDKLDNQQLKKFVRFADQYPDIPAPDSLQQERHRLNDQIEFLRDQLGFKAQIYLRAKSLRRCPDGSYRHRHNETKDCSYR